MRSTQWLSAIVLALAMACAPAAVALAAPHSLSGTAKRCTTSNPSGACGPYSYGQISNNNGYNTFTGNDCWADPSCSQTLTSYSPGDWSVSAREPAGNTGVRTYPNVQQLFSDWCGTYWNNCANMTDTPISVLHLLRSTFTENMHATAGTIAEAGYDIWLSDTSGSNEIMIWVDNVHRGTGGAAVIGHATIFGQPFTVLQYGGKGGEIIFSLDHNEQTGTVHILATLRWLQGRGYVPTGARIGQVDFGWEICSTGGKPETLTVSAYTLRSECSTHVCR
jgi:hypothetical protein